MPKEKTRPVDFSDTEDFQSFTISQLFPANIAMAEDGLASLNSPFAVLVALLSDTARLMPKDLTIRKGEVALIPPGYHCTFTAAGSSQLELAAVDFSFKSKGMDITAALPEEPGIISGKHGDQLAADVCAICNLADGHAELPRTISLLKAGYSIADALSQVLGWDSIPERFYSEDSEMQTLTSYLNSNYHLPLAVENIAAACNVSRRKLFKIAARHRSGTPMRLLKQIRLENSLVHLRNNELSISEIADKVGFLDARNFSREFKKQFNQSPQQYRQQSSLNVNTENLASKAELNLRMNLAKRASVLYRQAIESAPQSTDSNKLYYQSGLALNRAGDDEGAREAWRKVTTLHYRLLIGLEECVNLNKRTNCHEVVERLRRAYDYGNKELRSRVIDQLGDYMMQCVSSGTQVAAKHYTSLACELAPHNQILQPKLARALYITGQFEEIERWCTEQTFYFAGALRAMGKYQEHLQKFPELRQQNALIYLRMGEPEMVLENYRDFPETCVSALIESHRLAEAVSQFPGHNARALLALGRNEDLLKEYPEDIQMCAFAHANLGRQDEALAIAEEHSEIIARLLLHMERPHEITIIRAAKVLQAIHSLENGDHLYALKVLESVLPVTDPDHRIEHEFYHSDIIIPLIMFLHQDLAAEIPNSRWPSWPKHFSQIVQDYRYCYAQCMWYDARFILGDADENDYRAQPCRRDAENRLSLIKAVKADLQNDQSTASSCYQNFMDTLPPLIRTFSTSGMGPVLKAFVRWRLAELKKATVFND